jgi:AcrR family transcriptional regulator
MSVTPVTQKGSETRASILDRAVDLASVEGLEGLTIGRLAAELRMSKSGLFAHFGSKQELQLATVEAAARRFRDSVIVPSLEAPEGAPRIRAMGDRYLERMGDYSGGCFWAATPAPSETRSPPPSKPGSESWSARRGSPASSDLSASPSSSTRW